MVGFTRINGGTSRPFLDSMWKMEKLLRWQWAKPSIEKKMRYVFSLLGQSMFLHRVLLYPFSLENQLAFFHMSRVLLDFRLRREITQHFVLGEKFCQLFLQPYISLFFLACMILMPPIALNIAGFE